MNSTHEDKAGRSCLVFDFEKMETHAVTPEVFRENLNHFHGSIQYHHHQIGFCFLYLTDGTHYVREAGKAYWLFDLICFYQNDRAVRDHYFQVWKLRQLTDTTWKITCTDGNDNILVSQGIEYSDFPVDRIDIWVEGRVVLLPSEH